MIGILSSASVSAQQEGYVKSHLSVTDGLSQNEVTTICEDAYGFLWFGTRGGLNRYDGYNFRHFKPSRKYLDGLQNPSIERLSVSDDGRLWIGTKSGGFSIYDPLSETIRSGDSDNKSGQDRVISFFHDYEGGHWIGSFSNGVAYMPQGEKSATQIPGFNRVSSVAQSRDSTIWLGSQQGLFSKRPGGEFRRIELISSSYEVTEILVDDESGVLWLAGWGLQLIRYDYLQGSYEVFPLPYRSEKSTNSYSLLQDKNGFIWVGTWGEGLYKFDPGSREFHQIDLHREYESTIVADYKIVLDIFEDKQGIIWVGTDGGGIVKLSPSKQFNTIANFSDNLKDHVNAISKTKQGDFLIGTRGQSLFSSKDMKSFSQVWREDMGLSPSFKTQSVYYLGNLSDEAEWVGTEQGALILLSGKDGPPRLVKAGSYFNSPELDIPRKVLSLLLKEDELWMGTQQQGLYLFKLSDGKYKLIKHYTASSKEGELRNDRISNLILDKNKHLWVGTYNGLFQYHASDSSFIPIDSLLIEPIHPLCNIILTLTMDSDRNIWFGTPCSLNHLFEAESGKFHMKEFTSENGLPDDYISNILPDDSGNLWISSNAGISKFLPDKEEFQNFEATDGTGEYNFSEASAYKSDNGWMFFGGFSGITFFDPDMITINTYVPPIVITDFKILNSEVQVDESGILPVSINELRKLRLSYKEKEVSIEFAALDYKAPNNLQYAYNLERKNEDGEWIYTGKRREISLQNLEPGNYTLSLGGTNSNGVWNRDGKVIELEVIPPPWKSWYALLAYVLLIVVIVLLIVSVSLKQERLKSNAQLEHMNLEKEKELNEYKLRFFTNISHEFRTPLSLILAPINDLIKTDLSGLSQDLIKKIQIIYKNANKLLTLVNQLLEFRKIEVGKAKLEAGLQNFLSFTKELVEPFEELAEQKGIQLKISYDIRNPEIYFDKQKMIVVINNLLSNAFKYCGKPGIIEFSLTENEKEVIVSVANNGKKIPEKDRLIIFDRFYHISSDSYQGSSGIGLALVKNYMEMHFGTVDVESEDEGLTRFTIRLPKGKDHLEEEMIVNISPERIERTEAAFVYREKEPASRFFHHGSKDSTILIVEDNAEVIQYLQDLLSRYYNVMSAMNGKEGFDMAVEFTPDLVISDVMMPEMDGFELCQKIRKNEKISHLPIILLTAKDTPQDLLFGVKKGADDYITKPFDPEILMEKVKQLLLSRAELSKKFSKKIMLEPTRKEITSADEKFLVDAMKYVEQNITDPELNLENMARELAMSSTTMYRRMKSVCDQSPGEFIRTVRFKRASQLLRDTSLTISEIIEMVGYQDANRFRENFKNEFGLSPGQYREQFSSDSDRSQSRPDQADH